MKKCKENTFSQSLTRHFQSVFYEVWDKSLSVLFSRLSCLVLSLSSRCIVIVLSLSCHWLAVVLSVCTKKTGKFSIKKTRLPSLLHHASDFAVLLSCYCLVLVLILYYIVLIWYWYCIAVVCFSSRIAFVWLVYCPCIAVTVSQHCFCLVWRGLRKIT